MIKLEVKGLENVKESLDNLAEKAKELSGKHNIPLNELLSKKFLLKHTKYSTIEEMYNASGLKLEGKEDLSSMPEWDDFIHSVSKFDNWQEMLDEAVKDITKEKLGI